MYSRPPLPFFKSSFPMIPLSVRMTPCIYRFTPFYILMFP
nr:MAG TPA: hypothetical protein [Caudoviricetes sp.]